MRIKASIKQIDHGMRRIQATVKENLHGYVKVGMVGPAADANRQAEAPAASNIEEAVSRQAERMSSEWYPMTNAKLAAIHEFGTKDGSIPERSFIRSTMDENRPAYMDRLKKLIMNAVFAGKITYAKALGLMGEKISADMKRKVTTGPFEPNAPSTIAKKDSSRPLIATAQMRNSITYEVVK